MVISSVQPTILVVDDNADLRAWVSISLRKRGYNVQTAGGGFEAFQMLKDQGGFDAVVSDVQMDEGDGPWLLRSILDANLNIPVVLMSADMDISEADIQLLGGQGFLRKPFPMENLLSKLQSFVTFTKTA